MANDRLEIILSNLLIELYSKTFDCDEKEFTDYIRLEIGITDDEIEYLKSVDRWPVK